jgi:hypothetical protein
MLAVSYHQVLIGPGEPVLESLTSDPGVEEGLTTIREKILPSPGGPFVTPSGAESHSAFDPLTLSEQPVAEDAVRLAHV